MNRADLATRHRSALSLGIHNDPLFGHCVDNPPSQRFIGGVDQVWLLWRTDVAAEIDPCLGTSDQIRPRLDVTVKTEESDLVAAAGDEQAVTLCFGGGQRSHRFQPTSQSTASLAGALPPAAIGRHHDQRRQRRVLPRDLCRDIEGLRRAPADLCDECRLRALPGLIFQPFALGARDLQHRRPERLCERQSVEQIESGPAAAGEQHNRLVATVPGLRERAGLLFARLHQCKRLGLRQTDRGFAAKRSEPALQAFAGGEGGVKHRHAVDASIRNAQVARPRIDPEKRKRFERGFGARLPHKASQPFGRCMISRRCRAVVSLGVIGCDDIGEPSLQRV